MPFLVSLKPINRNVRLKLKKDVSGSRVLVVSGTNLIFNLEVTMAFSEEVVKLAFFAAGSKCECERTTHGHTEKCNNSLNFNDRGREGTGVWEAHHKNWLSSGGSDSLSNCEYKYQQHPYPYSKT